jgi:hypothetical protein
MTYTGMTPDMAENLNRAVGSISNRQELRDLLCIVVERCAFVRDTSPLAELWDARLVDALAERNVARIAGRIAAEERRRNG